ncbi:MAG: ABC transporter permease [Sedimentisphaerales bacterium]|jgi:putative ABC transport system permease protein|nr:ABC transporter permease [Sedimentisphaerales bacterium]HNY80447.1 ABC transporter permease [Sedimentisphaerales bacterium]HOC65288.1 ABC transporter permease [Sedimentisphaerales bacterium]HOH66212.1 ABC transporter permease [Sedimentisphaerales bacterium]HPY50310.1 ABC transporter permease [Sedimentisphaerales bacterium]
MFFFRLKRTIKLGAKSLWMHRLRSTLTALGIIFGVSSVIAMLAIGEGASRDAQEKIAQLGSRNIIIRTIKPPEDQAAGGQQQTLMEYGLTYDDAERFQNGIPDVQVIVPNRRISQQALYRNRRVSLEVVGTVPWYPEISPTRVRFGRFLSTTDMHYKQGVCILDERVVKELFAFDDPIGQDVKIGGDYYRVVGIATEQSKTPASAELETKDATGAKKAAGANVGAMYVPLTTVKERFGEMSLQISSGGAGTMERVELQEIIVQVQDVDMVMGTRQSVQTLLSRFHKKNDYEIVVPLELMRQAKDFQRIFTIVLGSIAAISLLVGGIGIMNIMMATVSERTREIGIRRALGAKKRDIVIQFLSETLILTLSGGLLGMGLGALIPFFVTHFGQMRTVITGSSLILAFGISGAVGIAFGLYPAYRAANMDPIESLRHE